MTHIRDRTGSLAFDSICIVLAPIWNRNRIGRPISNRKGAVLYSYLQYRSDVSDKLIHFTKATSDEDALSVLWSIVSEGTLRGGTGMIRGGYRCVCFTEAPISAVAQTFIGRMSAMPYAPFGLQFEKSWIFAQGGRPVIYEPETEYDILPEEIRWRHVRYEPIEGSQIDFSWEREWRLPCDELRFSPRHATIVLPDVDCLSRLRRMHEIQQNRLVAQYSNIFDDDTAEQYRDSFDWNVRFLQPWA